MQDEDEQMMELTDKLMTLPYFQEQLRNFDAIKSLYSSNIQLTGEVNMLEVRVIELERKINGFQQMKIFDDEDENN